MAKELRKICAGPVRARNRSGSLNFPIKIYILSGNKWNISLFTQVHFIGACETVVAT